MIHYMYDTQIKEQNAVKTREIRRYRRASRQFERLDGVQLKACCCGLTFAQGLILLEIDESGELTIGELAANLRLDHSTLSRTVDGLVRKQLLERRRDDEDRRLVRIKLTANGRKTCRQVHENNDAYCRGVFKKIPPAERETVIRSFETLVQAYLDHEAERCRLSW